MKWSKRAWLRDKPGTANISASINTAIYSGGPEVDADLTIQSCEKSVCLSQYIESQADATKALKEIKRFQEFIQDFTERLIITIEETDWTVEEDDDDD